MRIAIHTKYLLNNHRNDYRQYRVELFSHLVKQHPEHEFIFVNGKPSASRANKFKCWNYVKTLLAQRFHKADAWIQLLLVPDLAFRQYPQIFAWYHRWYYHLFTATMLRKAKIIVTASEYTKAVIIQYYQIPAQKITVVYGAAGNHFLPLSRQEKEQVKEGYADGREYFLFAGGIKPGENLLNGLKAFSLFKKWQHSNMKLLITGGPGTTQDAILLKLKTYKYREDVVLLDCMPDEKYAKITAAAYAALYPSFFEGTGLPIINAMQSWVPVICSSEESMTEIGGDAVLYANPADPEAIAKHMLSLYKDETQRNNLIEKGKLRAAAFNWEVAVEKCWEQILKTIEK